MKILLLHNNHDIEGGAEVFVHEVSRILKLYDHEVVLFSASNATLDTEYGQYMPGYNDYTKQGIGKYLNFYRNLENGEASKKLQAIINDFKPDLIHAFALYVKLTPSILRVAKHNNIPVVMSCNDYKHICPNYKLFHNGVPCEDCRGGKYYMAVRNKCVKNSYSQSFASALEAYFHTLKRSYQNNVDIFLFASDYMAQKTVSFWGDDFKNWRILRNPFSARGLDHAENKEEHILFFGRIVEEKGVPLFVQAAQNHPEEKFVVVGDGPELLNCKNQAKDLRLRNIVFRGEEWGSELEKLLSNCKFVVVPSLWHENFPYVILQSFDHGKPVIGSNRGGIPELIGDDERGVVFDADCEGSLSSAIGFLLDNGARRRELAANASHYVRTFFTDEVFYRRLMSIYAELVK